MKLRRYIDGSGIGLRIRKIAVKPLWFLYRALLRQRSVSGIMVLVPGSDADLVTTCTRIQGALDVLKHTDPRRYRIVQRYVPHILIWEGNWTAYDKWGGIHLAERHLEKWSDRYLAAALVHEATHLRIEQWRIPYTVDRRARIERLCIAEQAAFLEHFPDIAEKASTVLEETLEQPWWTPTVRRAEVGKLVEERGWPRWVSAVAYWIRGR